MHEFFLTASGSHWRRIGIKNHHGINLPLFSLRTAQSSGIGEFRDLLPLIEWCKELGLDVIQLLPLNDTGMENSPYSALSAFALNPIHISLASLPDARSSDDLKELLNELKLLSFSQKIDYKKLHLLRNQFLKKYIDIKKNEFLEQESYQKFANHCTWLEGYALFKSIKLDTNWKSWEEWPKDLKNAEQKAIEESKERYRDQIQFHSILQYLCFKQFQEVKQAANSAGVFIKGDIPILISRESADVWLCRHLFNMNLSAGAPPDMYSAEGQKWGFPLYNWEEMKNEGYRWWKERLGTASLIYDIYRIDHVVGFFRIWGVPFEKAAKEGFFVPKEKSEWLAQGKEILSMMLHNCGMFPIGEDLGVVPNEVRKCLHDMGVCGTKVIRWERHWETDKSFIDPKNYPPASMTTVSTHDSETLTLWWSGCPQEAKAYCNFKGWEYAPEIYAWQIQDMLKESHHSGSLFHINLLNEYLAIIPGLTWTNPNDERINVPGIVSDDNWSYRFKPWVEDLVQNRELKNTFSNLLGF